MPTYPWYIKLLKHDNSIQQGDFVSECPVVIPPKNLSEIDQEDSIEISIETFDVIVISQSCDIEQNNLDVILVCSYYTFDHLCEKLNYNSISKKKGLFNDIKNGRRLSFHMLNKSEEIGINEHLIIDFRNIFGINTDTLRNQIITNTHPRIRLAPPYREHLSQAFAKFFMRVGLPMDIQNPF
ncbi:MAG: hypothetical protein B6D61_03510 [Bacteroidetes bacterium 4484_249]|nr:MAG: hypothetical protein B6D61_03510 [Bacteroidetes bacterium 4484_249]